ncbi:MAG: hypothetical protein ACK4NX_00220, partial [Candidatus Paceibacteria bacterium]
KSGLSLKPSPNGKVLLISSGDIISVIDANGTILATPSIRTLVEKCAWASDNETLYCAVPENIPLNANLPFDFWTGDFSSSDRFVKYNYKTGQLQELKPATGFDVGALLVPKEENYLIFLNKTDNSLYSIRL